MEYISKTLDFHVKEPSVISFGKFDGLHRGHQKLIEKIRSYAGNDCVSVVCAFDMQRSCLMTKEERKNPRLLNGNRRVRIAKGSGTSVQEVNKLIKQLNEMKKMMKMFTSNSKGMKKRGGFPGLPFFR